MPAANGWLSHEVQVWRLAPKQHVLLLVQHHSMGDGVSMGILSRDLASAYNACLHNAAPQWPPLSVAYIDYAVWQRQQLDGAVLEAELAWWKHTLDGAPPLLKLPRDRPRPDAMPFAAAGMEFSTPKAVRAGLQELAAAQHTTPFVVVLAVLQVQRLPAECT